MSGASCSCFCYRGNSHSIENYGPKNSHATGTFQPRRRSVASNVQPYPCLTLGSTHGAATAKTIMTLEPTIGGGEPGAGHLTLTLLETMTNVAL